MELRSRRHGKNIKMYKGASNISLSPSLRSSCCFILFCCCCGLKAIWRTWRVNNEIRFWTSSGLHLPPPLVLLAISQLVVNWLDKLNGKRWYLKAHFVVGLTCSFPTQLKNDGGVRDVHKLHTEQEEEEQNNTCPCYLMISWISF